MKLYLLSLFFLISCGHGKIDFQSYPDKAEISVIEKDGQIKNLGKTPVSINMDEIFFSNGAVKLMLSKSGYRDEIVYLTKPSIQTSVKISAKLKEASSAKEIISNEKLEKVSNRVAEAQRYSFSKNYRKAEEILLDMIDEYPDISVPYDLLANIYYLTNDTNKALYYYQKAKVIAPRNAKRDLIINKLKRSSNANIGDV
jgi:tetratricopeptide (TPR) repeat protein